jgi:hypothetical protein
VLPDTELLLELVGKAHAVEDLAQYRHGMLGIVRRAVPCDRVAYSEITPDESFAITIPEFEPGLLPRFSQLICENTLIERFERTRDGRPYRISDLIDQPSFRRLALYRGVLPSHRGRVAGRVHASGSLAADRRDRAHARAR